MGPIFADFFANPDSQNQTRMSREPFFNRGATARMQYRYFFEASRNWQRQWARLAAHNRIIPVSY
jgi:hypothetical protein